MNYGVDIADWARARIAEQAGYIRDHDGAAAATRWLGHVLRAVSSLERLPLRCPLDARASAYFRRPIRTRVVARHFLLHFTVDGRRVTILHAQHGAQAKPWEPPRSPAEPPE